jgi:adenylate cyclase
MFNLVYSKGGEPQRFTLEPGDTVVGRLPGCDVVIDHPSVSRRHAKLTVIGGRCKLQDLESRNGTFVDREPVTETELTDGNEVVFGVVPTHIEYSAEDQLSLSESHTVLEAGTVYKALGEQPGRPEEAAVAEQGLDGRRVLAMMSEIGRTLVTAQPLISVLNRVVDLAFESIAAERAFLMLADDATGAVVPRVVRNRDGTTPPPTSISNTIVRRAMTERVAVLARDAQIDTRLAQVQSIHNANIRSFMCAPLFNGDKVIGVFYIDNPFTKEFSSSDLNLFTSLSDYAAVAIEQARLTSRVLEETRRRERLQRYHSPAVIDRILSETGEEANMALSAQERTVSVLFVDIVGFTTMSESMEPNEVAQVLNRFFTKMADVVFEAEGTLDKFLGDAILAVFSAPLDQPDHAQRAVRVARGMRSALEQLNQHSDRPLEVRIAINTGLATAGDIGSPKRRDYTVLGDVVNTCARMQANVCLPGQIVVSRATVDELGGAVDARLIGSFQLRGRQTSVDVYEVF